MDMGRKWENAYNSATTIYNVTNLVWNERDWLILSFEKSFSYIGSCLVSIFLKKPDFLQNSWFFQREKTTFESHFYTLLIALLCIFFLIEIVNKGSIFLYLKALPFSCVLYRLSKYHVFGRTNCNASNCNASNQHFFLYPLIMNLIFTFFPIFLKLSMVDMK